MLGYRYPYLMSFKMSTAISELVAFFGGQNKTAIALGVSQPTVNGWLSGKHGVSAEVALKAERISSGRIKATALCSRLEAALNPSQLDS